MDVKHESKDLVMGKSKRRTSRGEAVPFFTRLPLLLLGTLLHAITAGLTLLRRYIE